QVHDQPEHEEPGEELRVEPPGLAEDAADAHGETLRVGAGKSSPALASVTVRSLAPGGSRMRSATSAGQPVWCVAPRPAPLPPGRSGLKVGLPSQAGSVSRRSVPP